MNVDKVLLVLLSLFLVYLGWEILSSGLIATPQGRIAIQIGIYKYPVGGGVIFSGLYFIYLLFFKKSKG